MQLFVKVMKSFGDEIFARTVAYMAFQEFRITNMISPSNSNILTNNLATIKKTVEGIIHFLKNLNQKFERAYSGMGQSRAGVLEVS